MSNPPLVTLYLFISNNSIAKCKDGEVDEMNLEEKLLPILGQNGIKTSQKEIKILQDSMKEHEITVQVIYNDEEIQINPKIDNLNEPRVYISVGLDYSKFKYLMQLPLHERQRWLHFKSISEINPSKVFTCWLSYTNPMPEKNKQIPLTQFSSNNPIISIFTTTYRSGNRIQRPFQSLLKQTYQNWEWIILDDSGDNDETYNQVILPLKDYRIKKYRQEKNSGYIGLVKRAAAGLCTGEILVELDHDDDLTENCLLHILQAFKEHPDCGFAYGQCTEVYENSLDPHWYGYDAAFGYATYWRQHVSSLGRWQNILTVPNTNWQTIRHLVGLPNHPRAWTRDCYALIGGHRPELSVADDYDLLIRTFLCTRFVSIPHLLYIQYRNENGNNYTFKRNNQIQILCRQLEHFYHDQLEKRCLQLALPNLQNRSYERFYTLPKSDEKYQYANMIHYDQNKLSLIFILDFQRGNELYAELLSDLQTCRKNQWTFKEKNVEFIIVGNVPNIIEEHAKCAPDGVIRWWQLENTVTVPECLRYAQILTSTSSTNHIIHLIE